MDKNLGTAAGSLAHVVGTNASANDVAESGDSHVLASNFLHEDELVEVENVLRRAAFATHAQGRRYRAWESLVVDGLDPHRTSASQTVVAESLKRKARNAAVHANDTLLYGGNGALQPGSWPTKGNSYRTGAKGSVEELTSSNEATWETIYGDNVHPLAFSANKLVPESRRPTNCTPSLMVRKDADAFAWTMRFFRYSASDLNAMETDTDYNPLDVLWQLAWHRAAHFEANCWSVPGSSVSIAKPLSNPALWEGPLYKRHSRRTKSLCRGLGLDPPKREVSKTRLVCTECGAAFEDSKLLRQHFYGEMCASRQIDRAGRVQLSERLASALSQELVKPLLKDFLRGAIVQLREKRAGDTVCEGLAVEKLDWRDFVRHYNNPARHFDVPGKQVLNPAALRRIRDRLLDRYGVTHL